MVIVSMAVALFPNMVPSLGNRNFSLTIMNASSSYLTLKTMLVLALIGMPIVLVYTAWVHVTFSGRTGEEFGMAGLDKRFGYSRRHRLSVSAHSWLIDNLSP